MGIADDLQGLASRLVEPLRGWFVPWNGEDWITPTLVNSWVDFDATTYNAAGYWLDSVGVVHLRGLIKSGVVGSAAFVLPTGYRPSRFEYHAAASNSLFGLVSISAASGNVTPAAGSNVWFSLDGITFRAA